MDAEGHPPFDPRLLRRDLILIAGGFFLIWKATREIHETVDPEGGGEGGRRRRAAANLPAPPLFVIPLLDIVFSIDSILTAVGMTEHLPIMVTAVIVAVGPDAGGVRPLAAIHHTRAW